MNCPRTTAAPSPGWARAKTPAPPRTARAAATRRSCRPAWRNGEIGARREKGAGATWAGPLDGRREGERRTGGLMDRTGGLMDRLLLADAAVHTIQQQRGEQQQGAQCAG